LGNFKRDIKDDLQQSLGLITQHQEAKHDELLKLIKDQGHQQAAQSQPSDSSTSNTSPPPPPPPPYNSNSQPIFQYQPLMIYPPKAKIELSKYTTTTITNAWLGLTKLKNISIYIILQPMKKRLNTHPCTSKALHTIGTYGGNEESSHTL
jgi:hypothetical protein